MARPPFSGGLPFAEPDTRVPQDYQNIRATPESFGGLIAQGGERLGAGATVAAKFYSQIAAQQAVNNWQDQATDTLEKFKALKGQDAMNAQDGVLQSLKEAEQEGMEGLSTPDSRLAFSQSIRYLRARYEAEVGSHYDQQAQTWGVGVENASGDLAQRDNATAAINGDQAGMDAATQRLLESRMRAAHLTYGNNLTDQMQADVVARARADAATQQVRAIARTDPTRAMTLLNNSQGLLGPQYDALQRELEPYADRATVDGTIDNVTSGRAGPIPAAGGNLKAAITGQEGSGPNAVSPAGAVGTRQVTPGFFNQYARPGESFNNEADRVAVSDRGIDALSQKYNGDPDRVAVAYFSGEGNVAPLGSPTPWIADKSDGRTLTSQYVAGVRARLGGPPQQATQQGTRPYVVGDSIAVGIRSAGGYDGTAQTGAAPDAVLRSIQALPPDQVRGRDVVLSTGASNNPSQLQLIPQQIAALQSKGAGSVTLVGVGDRQDLQGVNGRLASIAQQAGVRFSGPLDPATLGADRVHPSDYKGLVSSLPRAADEGVARQNAISPRYMTDLDMIGQAYRQTQGMRPDLRERVINGVFQHIQRMNALENQAESRADKDLANFQRDNEAVLFGHTVLGETIPEQDLGNMLRTQQITPAGYNAIKAVQNRQAEGRDDPMTVAKLWAGIEDGRYDATAVYDGMLAGTVKGTTANEMIRAAAARSKTQVNAIEKGAYDTLKTALNGHMVEQGLVHLGNADDVAQANLWTQAQGEWNQRVVVNHEDPQATLADMMPRYVKATPSAAQPGAWPNPRFGAVNSVQDVATVAQKTRAAFEAGQINQDTFNAEGALLERYLNYYQAEETRKAAAAKTAPPGRRQQAYPMSPSDTGSP